MKPTSAQQRLLDTLSYPYRTYELHHPQDAYKASTLKALMKRGCIETYAHPRFLHGAVRLTDKGRQLTTSIEKE